MRKSYFIIAFLFAAIAVPKAQADTYPSPFGGLYYPTGATVTSLTEFYTGFIPGWEISYSFGDGTGYAARPGMDGDLGAIDFSTPITAVTFDYTSSRVFAVTMGGLTVYFPEGSETETVDFTNSVSSIGWIEYPASGGFGGITSLSYTEESVPTPEPSSLALLAIGLFGLMFFGQHVAPRSWRRARAERNS